MKDHWHFPSRTVQAPSTSPISCRCIPFARLQASELWPSPRPPPPSLHYILDAPPPQLRSCCWDCGPRAAAAAAADVVWRVVRSEIQCMIVLSESIMTATSQSRDVTPESLFIVTCAPLITCRLVLHFNLYGQSSPQKLFQDTRLRTFLL